MQIQINTDKNIEKTEHIAEGVREAVEGRLGRFGERVTRVEVHLSDVNAQKGGRDIRCVMEARLAGHQPVTVDDLAADVDRAVRNAAGKLERALDSRLGRINRR